MIKIMKAIMYYKIINKIISYLALASLLQIFTCFTL